MTARKGASASTTRPAPDLDPAHDAGTDAASVRAETALTATPAEQIGRPIVRGAGELRVGTASWTDPTMTRGAVFYPRGVSSAEDRLRYYASQFSVVEVDATYYSMPARATAQLWVDRTPDDFVFHVKAHALMTGQPTEVARLPEAIIEALPPALAGRDRIYATDLPRELDDAIWNAFIHALEPLHASGKLGGILLQYPRWFLPTPDSKAALARAAERLEGIPAAVEFRNHHWMDGAIGEGRGTDWTLAMLRELGFAHVVVDGPQGLDSSQPRIPAVTNPGLAVVRLHGRRAATWEAGGIPTVERYRYLYDERELAGIVPDIELLSAQARRTTVLLNNCYANYGATNARELVALLT